MMSAISGLGSSSFACQVGSVGGNRGGNHRRLETDLTNFLTTQGVSSEDQQSILNEIKDGISKASNGSRPDFSTLKDVVKSVLDSHGLSGDDFTSQIPTPPIRGGRGSEGTKDVQFSLSAGGVQGPPPGPPAGPPPGPPSLSGSDSDNNADDSTAAANGASSSTQDTKESLIKKLLAILSQSQDSNSTQSQTSSNSAASVLSSIDVTV
ncbi:MAG: hypothetical protein U0930_24540 [Pirellulales bacterium]